VLLTFEFDSNVMSKRNQPDKTPATLDAVVAALYAASRHNESELEEMVSAGSLRKLFSFKPHAIEVPPDTMPREQLRRASPLPLDARARKALIQASMPSRVSRASSAGSKEFEEIVAQWDVDNGRAAAFELNSHD